MNTMKKFFITIAILCIAGAISLMTIHTYEVRTNPEVVSLYKTLIQVDHDFCTENWPNARNHLAELAEVTEAESVSYAFKIANGEEHVGFGSPVIWEELTNKKSFWFDKSCVILSISLVGIAIASLVDALVAKKS